VISTHRAANPPSLLLDLQLLLFQRSPQIATWCVAFSVPAPTQRPAVDLSMNGTAIACGFEYYDVNSGTLEQCYSSTGVLYVDPISPEDYDSVTDVGKIVTSNSFNVWIALLLTVTITAHSVCE